jgi:hypothetical protein
LPSGSDPEDECLASPVEQCGVAGTGCDGEGSCRLYADGEPCADAGCADGVQWDGSTCDGAGQCLPGQASECGAYACNTQGTACNDSCAVSGDCAPGFSCQPPSCVGCPPPSVESAGYCWVIALDSGENDSQACARIGTETPGYTVSGLMWNAELMADVTWKLGCTNLGLTNCCAPSLWYYPADDTCETHALDQEFVNYGSWDPAMNVGVYACFL